MGILNKLQTEGSNLSKFDGETPTVPNPSTPESPLHNTYSLNGQPGISNLPNPSTLDLDGETPQKYLDNPPK